MPPAGEQTPRSGSYQPWHALPRLLVLSNGHGEDLIALRLIEALRDSSPHCGVTCWPWWAKARPSPPPRRPGGCRWWAPAAGPAQRWLQQPEPARPAAGSGGRPAAAELAPVADRAATGVGRPAGAGGGRSAAPAAGLGGGGPYGFLGTPKSDHTWASPPPAGWGRSRLADGYHRGKGSEWDPWEWALMGHRRCRLVAVRDRLTARGLRRHGVAALAPGNPMMDGFAAEAAARRLRDGRRLLLLPGSRLPEAMGNLARLLGRPAAGGSHRPITVLLAAGTSPALRSWRPLLRRGWLPQRHS